MLRNDGYVKVLDFGLAKLRDNVPVQKQSHEDAPTPTMIKTDPGAVLGTAYHARHLYQFCIRYYISVWQASPPLTGD